MVSIVITPERKGEIVRYIWKVNNQLTGKSIWGWAYSKDRAWSRVFQQLSRC